MICNGTFSGRVTAVSEGYVKLPTPSPELFTLSNFSWTVRPVLLSFIDVRLA